MATATQRELGEVQIELGREFGVGGSSWTVTDADGTARGTVTLYVRKTQQLQPELGGVGFATDTRWFAVGPLASLAADAEASGVWPGRRLVSVSEPARAFYVAGDAADTTRGIFMIDVDVLR